MTISKEVKTGVLVTSALSIFFIGFYFLKGANLFSNNNEYFCVYENVDGLQNSANVMVRGLVVGRVSTMKLLDNKGVRVEIIINKSVQLPEGTIVSLASADLLGTKNLNLKLGAGPGMLADGATLPAEKELGMLDNVSNELTPRLKELKVTIAAIDTTLAGINAILIPVKTTAYNLASLTGALNQQSGEIANVMHNLSSFTGNLNKQNDTINHMLANLNNVSRQLANAPIQKTVADLQHTIEQLKGFIEKMNGTQGTLGMLVNNKDLYNNLNNTVTSLQKLTDDLKAHPSRYINVTIFGKKKN